MDQTVKNVLLVDDEAHFLDIISDRIELMGMAAWRARTGQEAVEITAQRHLDLAIVDLNLPDLDGLVTITKLKEIRPDLKTVLLTGYGNEKVKQATAALNSAYFEKENMGDFWNFVKKFNQSTGMIVVAPPIADSALEVRENRLALGPDVIEMMAAGKSLAKQRTPLDPGSFRDDLEYIESPRLIGETPVMQELKRNIAKVAVLDCTVLIQGETGTGKELVARAIHDTSPRKKNRFLAINCGSFTQELLSNELFGHEKEAFTGALRSRKGLLESAGGGSILLDEIGETPFSMQVSLLRVLQEKTIIRVGGNQEVPIDVRVLAATNRSLRDKVVEGGFREDLYYRLNVFELSVPPLRDRRDDIPPLSYFFLDKFSHEFNKKIDNISDEVMEIFMTYAFPGNVRELENIIERAVVLSEERTCRLKHLPQRFQPGRYQEEPSGELISLAELEKRHIVHVLEATKGNKSKAARILGISRPALWRKLKLMAAEPSKTVK